MVDRRGLAGGPALTGPAHPGIFQILIEYKYVNKMRETIKKKLVDHMIKNGNNFSYTDMISYILKLTKGMDYEYNHNSPDRGYYATNFSKKWNGYMVNGKGPCGVHKNENGRYSGIYYKTK